MQNNNIYITYKHKKGQQGCMYVLHNKCIPHRKKIRLGFGKLLW